MSGSIGAEVGPALRRVPVLGSTMTWREVGSGRPVLLLHGNPTSSHLWRHVLAHAERDDAGHRWIAVDLIGMGASGKPRIDYRFEDHVRFVDAFVAALGIEDLVLVGHDWGVAIALDRLRRIPDRTRGVALMEGHIRPLAGWEAFDDGGRRLFQDLRTPSLGERMVLEEDFFLDVLLPAALQRPAPADLAVYRRPFPDAGTRLPLLQWAREIPVAGEPADVAARFAAAVDHLTGTAVPTLLLHGRPGVLVGADTVEWLSAHVPASTAVDVGGPAGHFLPEDRADEVAAALVEWVRSLA